MNYSRVNRAAVADWAAVLTAVCALIVTGIVAWRHVVGPSEPTFEDEEVDNWSEIVGGGRRIGPEDAPVTIVEFVDYECPFCRTLEPTIRGVLEDYPREVALVVRHKPLSYHQHAYQAARLAECAADQGRFPEAHALLYEIEDLGSIVASSFAASVGVRNPDAFVACAMNTEPVDQIEGDIVASDLFGITSTPTVLVNGLRLGRRPDRARLLELIEEELESYTSTATVTR